MGASCSRTKKTTSKSGGKRKFRGGRKSRTRRVRGGRKTRMRGGGCGGSGGEGGSEGGGARVGSARGEFVENYQKCQELGLQLPSEIMSGQVK